MSMKKPAQLSDNLLSIRPRKGEAKPQTEQQAAVAEKSDAGLFDANSSAPAKAAPRRRRRLSDKKMQLNLRVDEKSLERFTQIADDEGLIFGDLLKKLLDKYENK
jgi:predicted DNA binding CopG/RHH family protein